MSGSRRDGINKSPHPRAGYTRAASLFERPERSQTRRSASTRGGASKNRSVHNFAGIYHAVDERWRVCSAGDQRVGLMVSEGGVGKRRWGRIVGRTLQASS